MTQLEQLIYDKYIIGEPLSEVDKWDSYTYNGKPVPRVTHILSRMIHEEFLLGWANSLGFKRKSYTKERDIAATKGTYTHNMVEDFLQFGTIKTDFSDIEPQYRFGVYNAYNSFMAWWKMMQENTSSLEVVSLEQKLSCPFCGGTLDGLFRIDGKLYIVDFKTSNHMTWKYFLQLAAYQYMLESYNDIMVDGGTFVLWLDKNQTRYMDYVLDFSNEDHVNFVNHNKETFVSLLYAYYNINRTEDWCKSIFGKLV